MLVPLAHSLDFFTSYAYRTESPIHLLPITARNKGLWVGGSTETFCPSDVPHCSPANATVIGINADLGNATLVTKERDGQARQCFSRSLV